ncbi:c-type heme family protein [Flagellimonas zhangzhouensis]|uniref:Cytochrome c n=1 Tax=Flagellimonas zhangzhouensis TaxID=1073328 RepID=A0A1H2U7G4_9FLAO|nr:DUF3365 domain-containing protein [Allomuricauda zhangzhouensis]SDQ19498.1 Cytochrome c [Allomuricauda zhangzhouensis]SDW52086.1 Cytochrome c [Allomuricauda zhangzhouensis]
MKHVFIFIGVVLMMVSCKQGPKSEEIALEDSTSHSEVVYQEGKKLMEAKCYLCHNPEVPENGQRIAPPMIAVKAHYLDVFKTKADFVQGVVDFVKAPSEDNTQMRGAVRRFGIMPTQQFPEEEIKKIAEYMYEYQIAEPEWFKAHWIERRGDSLYNQGKKLTEVSVESSPKEMGMKYAQETQKVLGKNLIGTIQNKGVEEALLFCNERAYPLTDSMAVNFNASIKRVSDRPRNPKNTANAIEMAHIATFKSKVKAGESYEPIVSEKDGKVNFYYPIVTNSMCLNCHGTKGKEVSPEVSNTLAQLYPTDQAMGYGENEVRGIWSIVFDAVQPQK